MRPVAWCIVADETDTPHCPKQGGVPVFRPVPLEPPSSSQYPPPPLSIRNSFHDLRRPFNQAANRQYARSCQTLPDRTFRAFEPGSADGYWLSACHWQGEQTDML